MKILAVAPRYRPGRGPSNALYFLKYINGIKFLYYSNDILLEDKTLNVKLLKSPDRNHYVLSRVVRRLVEKVKPDYIISIAPELMLHLEEKDLERSVIIPQGFIEFAHIKHKPTAIRALPVYLEVIYVSKKVKGYAAISTYMYRRISTFLKPKKIELTYNPVREMFFELGHERMRKRIMINNDKLKLLYVGGLLNLKGVDKLIMWFPNILREFREAELHIVGDGPLRERLLYLIYKLNLRNNVFIHGRVNDDDLPQMYRNATLLVTASYWESFCIPVGEAAASAIPSIVREVYALKEHVELGYAIGFREDSSECFVEAVGKALDNYEKLARRGYEVSRKLFWPSLVAKRVLKLLGH